MSEIQERLKFENRELENKLRFLTKSVKNKQISIKMKSEKTLKEQMQIINSELTKRDDAITELDIELRGLEEKKQDLEHELSELG